MSELVARLAKLRNGSGDCDKIWCVFRDQVAVHITQVIGEVHLHARMRAPIFRRSGTAGRIVARCWSDKVVLLCFASTSANQSFSTRPAGVGADSAPSRIFSIAHERWQISVGDL